MPSKAITQTPESRPGSSWRNQPDTGPSLMRRDDPKIARGIGIAAAAAIIFGGMALILHTSGRVTPLGAGWAAFLLTVGIAGLLFHAAFDSDVQFRRVYMGFGYLCLIAGGFLAVVPYNKQPGALFSQGFMFLFLGLLFLLAFLRNEDDPWFRRMAENIIGGAGAAMAVIGLAGGVIKGDFLLPIGLLLAVLGLLYLTAFVGSRGIGDNFAYRAGLGIGAAGALLFVVAFLRSLLPPLFYRWHFTQTQPGDYLIPYGLLLMTLGLLYVAVSLLECSDWRWIVLTRRELGALFYSPAAYIVLFSFAIVHWLGYFLVVYSILRTEASMPEPIVGRFFLQWLVVIGTIVAVPVLTMRLLSEEKRSGTLEVLLTAPIDETAVVLSKFLAACIMYLVMWLPFGLLLIYLRIAGGSEFDYRPLFSFSIGLAATSAAFVSMGVFFSSLTHSQIASGMLTFAGMMGLTIVFLARSMAEPSSAWETVLKHLSYIDVWIETLDGRLLPRQLLFFVSMAVVWLFGSVKVLEARKWA
ncbi:MAG TPA: ABC transporter permease [Gemmataceae bacterium]|nr:ABC transporter permease [Gemmataceae bacterium]